MFPVLVTAPLDLRVSDKQFFDRLRSLTIAYDHVRTDYTNGLARFADLSTLCNCTGLKVIANAIAMWFVSAFSVIGGQNGLVN